LFDLITILNGYRYTYGNQLTGIELAGAVECSRRTEKYVSEDML
jgi:hypothetical protein